ncbi:MAG: helix-turn-helix transcriptional regulator [Pseudomonadota bacterium]
MSNIVSFPGGDEPEKKLEDEDRTSELLARVGQRVRNARKLKRFSRRVLSDESGVSQRYLAQLEAGQGNISIALLMRVADALSLDMGQLVSADPFASNGGPQLAELLSRANPAKRARALAMLSGEHAGTLRQRRVALIGLRGAGKSRLGRRVAEVVGVPFVELNREIERLSGLPVEEVVALYDQPGYRRFEREALEQTVRDRPSVIVAVSGGIVSEPDTFDYLLAHFRTIWLKATPEDHISRVRGAGMTRDGETAADALATLRQLLNSRAPYYAQADRTVDTSAYSEEAVVDQLIEETRHCGTREQRDDVEASGEG